MANAAPLVKVVDDGTGGSVALIPDGYLEMDVQVPHLSYKIVGNLELRDEAGVVLVRAPVPEHHQTRFVLDGDVLTNRLRIELQPSHFPDRVARAGRWDRLRSVRLSRGGDPGLELVAPSQRPQIKWRVDSLRLRRGCKDCGRSPLGFDHLNALLPLLPSSYIGAAAQSPGVTGAGVALVKTTTTVSDSRVDLTMAVDPGCNCLHHAGATLQLDLYLRSALFPVLRVALVDALSGRLLMDIPVGAAASGTAADTDAWRTVRVPVPGSANVWDHKNGVPSWTNLRLRVTRGGVATPVPALAVVPTIRNVAYVAAPKPAETYVARLLRHTAVLQPLGDESDEDADTKNSGDNGDVPVPAPPPEGSLLVVAGAGAAGGPAPVLPPGSPAVVNVPSDWLDLAPLLGAACAAPGGWPAACGGVQVGLDLKVFNSSRGQLDTIILWDADGRQASLAVPAPALVEAQADAGHPADATRAWHRVEVFVATDGPAAPFSFRWNAIAKVGFKGSTAPPPVGSAAALAEAVAVAAGLPKPAVEWGLTVRDVRVGVPQRVGHVWDPLDNYDDLGCNFGWGQYSLYRRNGPARYSHCFECCCYFDSPATLEKHCYDHGDVLGEVTPSDAGGPNEHCQVCNRKVNPQVATPRTTLLTPAEVAANVSVPCDDLEPCSYSDTCTTVGTCEAVEYTTCLVSDFWGGDPSKNCEECDGTGPHSASKGCKAKVDHYVYEPGTDGRVCGCFIDGVVWPHLTIHPTRPCLKCDVTVDNTAWTPLNDDVICDISQQIDWVHAAPQACTYGHTCLAGICGGARYACAPLQQCEAIVPELPAVCDTTGPASATGGCQRLTLPAGTHCGAVRNGCTPQPVCNGALGTCPALQRDAGIIYDDDGKSIALLMPDGTPAHPDLPAMPDGSLVYGALVNYRVQCDELRVRMAVVPAGDCLTPRVSGDLGDGFGAGEFPQSAGTFALSAGPMVLGSNFSRASVDKLAAGFVANNNQSALTRDTNLGGLALLTARAAAYLPLDTPSLSSLVSESCRCVLGATIEMEVFLVPGRGGGVLDVLAGYLVDGSGSAVEVEWGSTTEQAGTTNGVGRWRTLTAAVQPERQMAATFDWASLAGLGLRVGARSGQATASVVAAGRDATATAAGVFAVVRDVRLRLNADPACPAVDMVGESPLELRWSDDGSAATAELPAPKSALPLWTQRTASFADVFVSLEARPLGAHLHALAIDSRSSAGLKVPLPRPATAQDGWVAITVKLHRSMIPVDNNASAWVALSRVAVVVNATTAPAARWRGSIAVRNLRLVRDTGRCGLHDSAASSWLQTEVLGPAIDAPSRGASDGGVGGTRSLVLEPQLDTRVMLQGPLRTSEIVVHETSVSGLANLYNASCACFPAAYVEVVASFESSICTLSMVELVDSDGNGLKVPLAVDADAVGLGARHRHVLRTRIEASHVVGPPAEWADTGILRFHRAGPLPAVAADLAPVTVHSIAVRSHGVPCMPPRSGFDATDRPPVVGGGATTVFEREVELDWVPGRAELVPPHAAWVDTPRWPGRLLRFAAAPYTDRSLAAPGASWLAVAVAGAGAHVVTAGSISTGTQLGITTLDSECVSQGGCAVLMARRAATLAPEWAVVASSTIDLGVPARVDEAWADVDALEADAGADVAAVVCAAGWVHSGAAGGPVYAWPTAGEGSPLRPGAVGVVTAAQRGLGGTDAVAACVDAETGRVRWLRVLTSKGDDKFHAVATLAAASTARGSGLSSAPHAAGRPAAVVAVGDTTGTGRLSFVGALFSEAAHVRGSRRAGIAVGLAANGTVLWRVAVGHHKDRVSVSLVSVAADADAGVAFVAGTAQGGRVGFTVNDTSSATGGTLMLAPKDSAGAAVSTEWSFIAALNASTGRVLWTKQVAAGTDMGSSLTLASLDANSEGLVACGTMSAPSSAIGRTWPHFTVGGVRVRNTTVGANAVVVALGADGSYTWSGSLGGATTSLGVPSVATCTAVVADAQGRGAHTVGAVAGGVAMELLADAVTGSPGGEALLTEAQAPPRQTAGLIVEWSALASAGIRSAQPVSSSVGHASLLAAARDAQTGELFVVGGGSGELAAGLPRTASFPVGPMADTTGAFIAVMADVTPAVPAILRRESILARDNGPARSTAPWTAAATSTSADVVAVVGTLSGSAGSLRLGGELLAPHPLAEGGLARAAVVHLADRVSGARLYTSAVVDAGATSTGYSTLTSVAPLPSVASNAFVAGGSVVSGTQWVKVLGSAQPMSHNNSLEALTFAFAIDASAPSSGGGVRFTGVSLLWVSAHTGNAGNDTTTAVASADKYVAAVGTSDGVEIVQAEAGGSALFTKEGGVTGTFKLSDAATGKLLVAGAIGGERGVQVVPSAVALTDDGSTIIVAGAFRGGDAVLPQDVYNVFRGTRSMVYADATTDATANTWVSFVAAYRVVLDGGALGGQLQWHLVLGSGAGTSASASGSVSLVSLALHGGSMLVACGSTAGDQLVTKAVPATGLSRTLSADTSGRASAAWVAAVRLGDGSASWLTPIGAGSDAAATTACQSVVSADAVVAVTVGTHTSASTHVGVPGAADTVEVTSRPADPPLSQLLVSLKPATGAPATVVAMGSQLDAYADGDALLAHASYDSVSNRVVTVGGAGGPIVVRDVAAGDSAAVVAMREATTPFIGTVAEAAQLRRDLVIAAHIMASAEATRPPVTTPLPVPSAACESAMPAEHTAAAVSRGLFVRSANANGIAHGEGVSVGSTHVLVAGFFQGFVAVSRDLVLKGSDAVGNAGSSYDGFFAMYKRSDGEAAGRSGVLTAAGTAGTDDRLVAACASRDGSMHLVAGTVDSGTAGSIFLSFNGTAFGSVGGVDGVVAAISDDDGSVLWADSIGASTAEDEVLAVAAGGDFGVAVGSSLGIAQHGSPPAAVYASSIGTRRLATVFTFALDGLARWGTAFGTVESDGQARATAVAVSADSRYIAVAGAFKGALDVPTIGTLSNGGGVAATQWTAFVVLLDAGTGAPVWATSVEHAAGPAGSVVRALAFPMDGELRPTGEHFPLPGSPPAPVDGLVLSGEFVGAGATLATNSSGGSVAVGASTGTAGEGSAFIALLTLANGTAQWVYSPRSTRATQAPAVVVSGSAVHAVWVTATEARFGPHARRCGADAAGGSEGIDRVVGASLGAPMQLRSAVSSHEIASGSLLHLEALSSAHGGPLVARAAARPADTGVRGRQGSAGGAGALVVAGLRQGNVGFAADRAPLGAVGARLRAGAHPNRTFVDGLPLQKYQTQPFLAVFDDTAGAGGAADSAALLTEAVSVVPPLPAPGSPLINMTMRAQDGVGSIATAVAAGRHTALMALAPQRSAVWLQALDRRTRAVKWAVPWTNETGAAGAGVTDVAVDTQGRMLCAVGDTAFPAGTPISLLGGHAFGAGASPITVTAAGGGDVVVICWDDSAAMPTPAPVFGSLVGGAGFDRAGGIAVVRRRGAQAPALWLGLSTTGTISVKGVPLANAGAGVATRGLLVRVGGRYGNVEQARLFGATTAGSSVRVTAVQARDSSGLAGGASHVWVAGSYRGSILALEDDLSVAPPVGGLAGVVDLPFVARYDCATGRFDQVVGGSVDPTAAAALGGAGLGARVLSLSRAQDGFMAAVGTMDVPSVSIGGHSAAAGGTHANATGDADLGSGGSACFVLGAWAASVGSGSAGAQHEHGSLQDIGNASSWLHVWRAGGGAAGAGAGTSASCADVLVLESGVFVPVAATAPLFVGGHGPYALPVIPGPPASYGARPTGSLVQLSRATGRPVRWEALANAEADTALHGVAALGQGGLDGVLAVGARVGSQLALVPSLGGPRALHRSAHARAVGAHEAAGVAVVADSGVTSRPPPAAGIPAVAASGAAALEDGAVEVRVDVMLSSLGSKVAGGVWRRDGPEAGPGLRFALDPAHQTREGQWMTLTSTAVELVGGASTAADLASLVFFSLLRQDPDRVEGAPHADLAPVERTRAGWRVRRVRLVPTAEAAKCPPCGTANLLSGRRALSLVHRAAPAATGGAAGVGVLGARVASWYEYVPACAAAGTCDASRGRLDVAGSELPAVALQGESPSAYSMLLPSARDVGLAVDPTCNCLAGAVLEVVVCATAANAGADPTGEAAAAALVGLDLTDAAGGRGLTLNVSAGAAGVSRQPAAAHFGGCTSVRAVPTLLDHVAAADTDWRQVRVLRLRAAAGAAPAGIDVAHVEIARPCPSLRTAYHPVPRAGNATMWMRRTGLNMAHGQSYRLLTVESNVWGDDSPPTCSPAFVVDETAPDVSAVSAGDVYDMWPSIGATRADVTHTRFAALKVAWDSISITEPESAPTNLLVYSIANITAGSPTGPGVAGVDEVGSRKELPRTGAGDVESNEVGLVDGVQYFAHLRVTNPAARHSTVFTNGVIYDASPPAPTSAVRDVQSTGGADGVDITHQLATDVIRAAWDGLLDPHTSVDEVLIGLGTAPNSTNTVPWTTISVSATSHSFSAPGSLPSGYVSGQRYFSILRVFNPARAYADYPSSGLYIDTSAPYPMWANDVWFRNTRGFGTKQTEDADTGDVDVHDGKSIVRGKWKCDDDESVAGGARGTMTYRWRVCDSAACDGTLYFLSASQTDGNGWMDVGATRWGTSPQKLPGVALGTRIYIQVECTNPVGLTHVFASDGAEVSDAPPDNSSAVIADQDPDTPGVVVDVDYHDSPTLKVEWSGFLAAPGPVVGGDISFYDFAVGTTPGGSADVLDWTWVGLNTHSVTNATETPLVDGVTYYVTARAVSVAGGSSIVVSDGVTVDQSAPVFGAVSDVRPFNDTALWCPGLESQCRPLFRDMVDDFDAQPNNDALAARLFNHSDPHTSIVSIQFGFSTCEAALDLNTVPLLPTSMNATTVVAGLDLFHGQRYCAVAYVTNQAGAMAVFISDGVTVDLTPPEPYYANEGPHVGFVNDVDAISSTDALVVSHQCRDPEAPAPMTYELRIDEVDASGALSPVMSYLDVGYNTTSYLTGLGLAHLKRYILTARCVSEAGLFATVSSDGFEVDTTAPDVSGAIIWHAPHRVHADYQAATNTLTASWTGARDGDSGIVSFAWSAGTTPGGHDVVPLTHVGAATWATKNGLAVADGTTVFVTVHVWNAAGLSSVVTSTGITIDSSPASGGDLVVLDLEFADHNATGPVLNSAWAYLRTTSRVRARWDSPSSFVDPHTNTSFKWAIGSSAFGQQVVPFTATVPDGARWMDAASLQLAAGGVYYLTVRATNRAGLTTHTTSQALFVDPFAPEAGTVFDGASPEAAKQLTADLSKAHCSWRGFRDELSGAAWLHVGLGTAPGATDIHPFVPMRSVRNASHTFTGLALVSGQRTHCVVRVTDHAGWTATASSSGIMPDDSPPTMQGQALLDGLLMDGAAAGGVDIDFQVDATALRAWWPSLRDPQSGVVAQEWALGTTTPGGTEVMGWTRLDPFVRTATKTGLTLSRGTTYYASLRATNALGMAMPAVTSDGITILNTIDTLSHGAAFQPRVSLLGLMPVVPRADKRWCDCLSAGAEFDPVLGACSCGAGLVLDPWTRGCVPCPTGTCKPGAGNAARLCVPMARNTSACPTSLSPPAPVNTSALLACGPEPTHPRGVRGVWDGGNCVCPPGARRLNGECLPCGAGQFKLAPGDDSAACRHCWAALEPDALLHVNYSIPPQAATMEQPVVVVSVGLGAGAARWSVEANATHAEEAWTQFSLRDTGAAAMRVPFQQDTSFHVALRLVDRATAATIAETRVASDAVDFSPPSVGTVIDGSGLVDADVFSNKSAAAASWFGFTDDTSGVVRYEIAFGDPVPYVGGANGFHAALAANRTSVSGSFVDVGASTQALLTGLRMAHLQRVAATVRAYNALGAVTQASSDGVTVQSELPSGEVVVRGDIERGALDATPFPHRHAPGQTRSDRLFVSWLFGGWDDGGALLRYTLRVEPAGGSGGGGGGGSSGAATPVPTALMGGRTSVVLRQGVAPWTGAALVPGKSYVAVVTAFNEQGVVREARSPPTLVDSTAPANGTVSVLPTPAPRAGALTARGPAGQVYQTSSAAIQLGWSFDEAETNVTAVRVTIGGVRGGAQVAREVVARGDSSGAMFHPLRLTQGECYVSHVTATNGVGVQAARVVSDPVCVDQSAPLASIAALMTPADGATIVGAVPGIDAQPQLAAAVAGRADAARREWLDARGVLFQHAYGQVGGAGVAHAVLLELLAQDRESGVSDVRYAMAEASAPAPPSPAVLNWTAVPLLNVSTAGTTTLNASGVDYSALPAGQPVWMHVRVSNGAGTETAGVSPYSVVVDGTPPNVTGVRVSIVGGRGGRANNTLFQQSPSEVHATWAAVDGESAVAENLWRIDEVRQAAGPSLAHVQEVMPWRSVGTLQSAAVTGLDLKAGSAYRVRVASCNVLGQCSASDPRSRADPSVVVVDTSRPSVGVIYLGARDQGLEGRLCAPTSTAAAACTSPWPPAHVANSAAAIGALNVSFGHFSDAESGIVGYTVSVGTVAMGVQVVSAASVGLNQSVTLRNLVAPAQYRWLPANASAAECSTGSDAAAHNATSANATSLNTTSVTGPAAGWSVNASNMTTPNATASTNTTTNATALNTTSGAGGLPTWSANATSNATVAANTTTNATALNTTGVAGGLPTWSVNATSNATVPNATTGLDNTTATAAAACQLNITGNGTMAMIAPGGTVGMYAVGDGSVLYVTVTAVNGAGITASVSSALAVVDGHSPQPEPVWMRAPRAAPRFIVVETDDVDAAATANTEGADFFEVAGADSDGGAEAAAAAREAASSGADVSAPIATARPRVVPVGTGSVFVGWSRFTDGTGSGVASVIVGLYHENGTIAAGPMELGPDATNATVPLPPWPANAAGIEGPVATLVAAVTAVDSTGNAVTVIAPSRLLVDGSPPAPPASVRASVGHDGLVEGAESVAVSRGLGLLATDVDRDCLPRAAVGLAAGVPLIASSVLPAAVLATLRAAAAGDAADVADFADASQSRVSAVNTSKLTVLTVAWPAFDDAESGVARVEAALGTTPGGTQLVPFTRVTLAAGGNAAQFVLPLQPEGTRLYASVRARNGAGLVSAPLQSDGVRLLCAASDEACEFDGLFLCAGGA